MILQIKQLTAVFLIAVLFVTLTAVVRLTSVQAEESEMTNLALNKFIMVEGNCGENPNFPILNAVDGDKDTRWSATRNAPGSVIIDFGATVTFNRVDMLEYRAKENDQRLAKFDIYYSNDKSEWTKCYSGTTIGRAGRTDNLGIFYFDEVSAQYMKVDFTKTNNTLTLLELSVYFVAVERPQIEIAMPADGAEYKLGHPVPVMVRVTPGNNPIDEVVFYSLPAVEPDAFSQNGDEYSCNFTFDKIGEYQIVAKVTDDLGISNESDVSIHVVPKNISANYALNRPAYTEGNLEDNPSYQPELVVDGVTGGNSRWSAARNATGKFVVNLEVPRTFNTVSVLEFVNPDYRINNYRILSSNDGTRWNNLYEGTYLGTTPGAEAWISFEETTAQYVALEIVESANIPSLYEFGVYLKNVLPNIEITEPNVDMLYNFGETITVSVEMNDKDGEIVTTNCTLDGIPQGEPEIADGIYQWKLAGIETGTHVIKVTATDDADEMREQSVTINVYPFEEAFFALAQAKTGAEIKAATETYVKEYQILGISFDNFLQLALESQDAVAAVLSQKTYTYDEAGRKQLATDFVNVVILAGLREIKDAQVLAEALEKENEALQLDMGEGSPYASLGTNQSRVCEYLLLLHSDYSSIEELQELFIEAIAVVTVQHESYRAIGVVIEKYAEELKLDLSVYNILGDYRSEVWRKMIGQNCDTLEDLKTIFTNACTAVKNEMQNDNNRNQGSFRPTHSGSGGGGSRGGNPVFETDINVSDILQNEKPDVEAGLPDFVDLPADHWARGLIARALTRGILEGDGQGNIYPDRAVTREEFVAMLVRAFALEETDGECGFADASEGDWYFSYVNTVYQLGIVLGVDDENFGVGQNILRQDACVMLDRVLNGLAAKLKSTNKNEIKDMQAVADYAKDSVQNLMEIGVVRGDENQNIRPASELTRTEAASMFLNMLERMKNENEK